MFRGCFCWLLWCSWVLLLCSFCSLVASRCSSGSPFALLLVALVLLGASLVLLWCSWMLLKCSRQGDSSNHPPGCFQSWIPGAPAVVLLDTPLVLLRLAGAPRYSFGAFAGWAGAPRYSSGASAGWFAPALKGDSSNHSPGCLQPSEGDSSNHPLGFDDPLPSFGAH